jgi:c-di-GMP-related signal transduction protein
MDKSLATRLVARQPIVDAQRQLAGFELLFRDSTENRTPACDPTVATRKTLDAAVLLGLDILSAGHQLFLNCGEKFLLDGFPTLFPAELTVIEVLETVRPLAEIVETCGELKRLGYRIALDDFVPQPSYDALVYLADLIKVDVQATSRDACAALAKRYLARNLQLLAEKVETEEQFQTAVNLGFTLFQGHWFSKPAVLSTASLGELEVNRKRVCDLLSEPHLDLVEAENVIKSDPALFYRLLKYLASPAFYLQSEIRSVLQALMLLGPEQVRKWLVLVSSAAGEATSAQKATLNAALVRAKFVELIATEAQLRSPEPFLLGLLSSFDSILGLPVNVIADDLAVSEDVRAALVGTMNPLRGCLEMALASKRQNGRGASRCARNALCPRIG